MDIKSEILRVQGFVDKGNYHAAINIAISALNECRRIEDQASVDNIIDVIKGIVNTMGDEFGSK